MMNMTYDKEADAAYLKVSEGIIKRTIPIDDETIIDADEHGTVIGVEFLNVKARKGNAQLLALCSEKPF